MGWDPAATSACEPAKDSDRTCSSLEKLSRIASRFRSCTLRVNRANFRAHGVSNGRALIPHALRGRTNPAELSYLYIDAVLLPVRNQRRTGGPVLREVWRSSGRSRSVRICPPQFRARRPNLCIGDPGRHSALVQRSPAIDQLLRGQSSQAVTRATAGVGITPKMWGGSPDPRRTPRPSGAPSHFIDENKIGERSRRGYTASGWRARRPHSRRSHCFAITYEANPQKVSRKFAKE